MGVGLQVDETWWISDPGKMLKQTGDVFFFIEKKIQGKLLSGTVHSNK